MFFRATHEGPPGLVVAAFVTARPEFLSAERIQRRDGTKSIIETIMPSVDDETTTTRDSRGLVDTAIELPELGQGSEGLRTEQVADAADARMGLEIVVVQGELPTVP
jgi:hypothetical protein